MQKQKIRFLNSLDHLQAQLKAFLDGEEDSYNREAIYQTCLTLLNQYELIDAGNHQNPYYINQHLAKYLLKAVDIREGHWDARESAQEILEELQENYIKRNLPEA
jgi:hypothetical protein